MNSTRSLVSIVLLLLVAGPCDASEKSAPLFASSEPLQIVLTLPIRQLQAQKSEGERLYLEGQLAYRDAGGELVRLSVKARVRGNFRLQTCYYPPLRLNLLKKQVKKTLFAHQDKLKLVNPCRKSDRFEELVMLEYLAYRLYGTLTDESFRVRPLLIHFVDSMGGTADRNVFGFLIEEDDALAERTGLRLYEENSAAPSALDPAAAARVDLFEYLIGNNDYSLVQARPGDKCCHNARLLGLVKHGGLVPTPYDFDFSGLVNAPYATPPPALPIRSVRVRYFAGRCRSESDWQAAIAQFNERRASLYREVAVLTQLDDATRKRTVDYLDDFFSAINEEKAFRKQVLDRCRS